MCTHSFIRWWAQRLFLLGDIMNNPLANMHVQVFCTNTFPVPLGILTRNRIVWLYGNLCLAFWEIAGPFSKRAAHVHSIRKTWWFSVLFNMCDYLTFWRKCYLIIVTWTSQLMMPSTSYILIYWSFVYFLQLNVYWIIFSFKNQYNKCYMGTRACNSSTWEPQASLFES